MDNAITLSTNTDSQRFVVPAWLTLDGAAIEGDIDWLNKFDPFLPIDSATRTRFEDIYSRALTFILALPNAADVLRNHF